MPHKSMRPKHTYGASKYDSELYRLEQTDIPWIGLVQEQYLAKAMKPNSEA